MAPAPRLVAPPGACDTHIHVYEAGAALGPRALGPGPAHGTVEAFRQVMARLGTTRAVVVQPTAYGADNRVTMGAVAALGLAHARAIVVVEPDVAEAELARLHATGARGVRFQMWPGGHLPWEALEPLAARVAPLGWHIQLQLNGRLLAERDALLRRLPCPVVIDHVGRFTPPVPIEHEAFRALLGLLETGRCWLKLSGPYGSSLRPDWADVAALARAAADAAPERMLWASDWPHPSESVPPDDARLLDVLLDWIPDEARRRRALADNPAALYGFAPP